MTEMNFPINIKDGGQMNKRIDLAGVWHMAIDRGDPMSSRLPGSNYLTLMEHGMEDPFYGTNETEASEAGHHDHTFTRTFVLSAEDLAYSRLDFVGDGIDTICDIRINGTLIGHTDNLNRVWRFHVKPFVQPGENVIELSIHDPYAYMLAKQHGDAHLDRPGKEKAFIRKAPCHFGWDWGPKLTPSGVIRSIGIEACDCRIAETRIGQSHENGRVILQLWMRAEGNGGNLSSCVCLTAPSGAQQELPLMRQGNAFTGELEIADPQLWWVAGLGEQPLYTVVFRLQKDGSEADTVRKSIGLRTVTLDTTRDEYGEQFRFIVNGVPIFVRGADWIPPDAFVTRFTRDDMEFYLRSVRDAGMNMLRVWGGGMYESEDFYDMCDRYGVLVWQDFIFACELYPFYREDFLQNVRAEVEDNVRRLRHRASLALWCGNNEIDALYPVCRDKALLRANKEFFYCTLRDWVSELDGVTAYWPGSPSSGHIDKGIQNFRRGRVSGDSHLWNIWHGMLPIEDFRKFPTRFCSEFGMESMPAMKTIRRINPHEKPDLFDDVMLLHQKSSGGNAKILYYLLQKYRRPKMFEDFVYLSQIVQSNAMRFATECWRRNLGKQNGAILWQLNDCWPVASWAIIDYHRQYKATMYHARTYNRMLMISNDYYDDRAELYVINEYPRPFTGTLQYAVKDFAGMTVRSGSLPVEIDSVASKRVFTLPYEGLSTKDVYLKTRLISGETVLDEKLYLLVPDKDAALPKTKIAYTVSYADGLAQLALCANSFARYVYVDSDAVWENWSDNYFDLEPGQEKVITVPLKDVSKEAFEASLSIRSLTDIEPFGTPEDDRRFAKRLWRKEKLWLTYYAYKLLMAVLWFSSIGD